MPVLPSTWNVPYQRNPFFTGREDVLKHLHDTLTTGKMTALTQPQAISGLGGIGKTQTAVEYAYRYGGEYRAVIWAKADSREVLASDFVSIADVLNVPEKNEQDQNEVVNAVKRWLQAHADWLLILDNVENVEMVNEFFPTVAKGHVLLTTRAQATGTANRVDIPKLEPKEGADYLLRRAKIIKSNGALEDASESNQAKAREISHALDGLPLALDQAGAYIEEAACTLSEYLNLYQAQRAELLKERGQFTFGHPESVVTTFSLAFQKVQEISPTAAELLRICTFLHPDVIPEEIFTDYAPHLDPTLQPIVVDQSELNTAIKSLLKFSLVRRNPNAKMLTIHRLVQAVLEVEMDECMQRQWAERTVRSISRSFPFASPATWSKCQRCLPHAYVCEGLIEQWHIELIEASGLLYRMGRYSHDRALYGEAELHYQKALTLCEKVKGSKDIDVASILSGLAEIYRIQGKYEQAKTLYQRALKIRKEHLGQEHPKVGVNLKDLADLYSDQGKYAQAEPLYLKALKICRKALGAKHHEVGAIFNNLALLYHAQGKYAEAEQLYQESLMIKMQEPEDINLSSNLSNLANLYLAQGRYTEAEPLSQRALAICEIIQGPEHPDVATKVNNLASLHQQGGKYAEAESLHLRAIAINVKILGPDHPHVAQSLNNLALLYYNQGKYEQAELLYQRALAIKEKVLGPQHSDTALSLNNLAGLYDAQGKYEQAEPLYQRALAIREQVLGPQHPDTALSLNNLAVLYDAQGKYEQAEPLLQRALAIWEKTLGPDHPNVASGLENYAALLRKTNREAEAIELETRAKEIRAKHAQENPQQ